MLFDLSVNADFLMHRNSDFDQDGVGDQTHPKLYFGKWKHALYENPQPTWEKNTYVVASYDFRNDDYYFLAYNNLRNADDPSILDSKSSAS